MNDNLNFLLASDNYWVDKFNLSIQTNGHLPVYGKKAPDCILKNSELEDVSLDAYLGKRKVLIIIPSLDVPICKAIIRKLHQEQANLENTVILTISADLPFSQRRFFEYQSLSDVITLSTFRSTFAKDYGVEIVNGLLAGLMAPAIVVLDENNKVIHTQIVEKLAEELNYELVLAALKPKENNRRGYFRTATLNPCHVDIELPEIKDIDSEQYKDAHELALRKIQENFISQHHYANLPTAGSTNTMRLNICDISPSGCSMFNYDEEFSYFLTRNTTYHNCVIHLSDQAEIKVAFKIVSKHSIGNKNIVGLKEIIGVEFINMTQAIESTISFFVKEIERKQLSERYS